MITRRGFLRSIAGGAVAMGAGSVYARFGELHWIDVVRRPLPIAGLPAALAGRTLVQISDLHAGAYVDDDYLMRTFAHVRALAPDVLVVTGDFITGRPGLVKAPRIYEHLPHGRIATLGIFGNHDYGRDWSHPEIAGSLVEILTPLGVEILRNEVRDVEGLQVAGFDDLWAGRFEPRAALDRLDPSRPMLALSHNPDTVDMNVWRGFRGWILSGHTHGGQVRIPPFPPPVLPVRNKRYAAGKVALSGGRTLYVNRGIGHWKPIRFGVRPEITVFDLRTRA